MHAYLVTGFSGKRQEQTSHLLDTHAIAPFNRLIFTPAPSHKIDTVREIIHSLTIRTGKKGQMRAVVIEDAHLMTPEAQNAFLKTLEEPPGDTIIILTAPREDLLLPTIVSRCVLITTPVGAPDVDYKKQEQLFRELKKAGIGEKIKFLERVGKHREDALEFIEGQLALIHTKLHDSTSSVAPHVIRALLFAHQDLTHNINPKMVLFELLRQYTDEENHRS